MNEDRPRTFPERRGLTQGGSEREPHREPYSAASYCAQYGIPLEDAQDLVRRYKTHGEIRDRIQKEYLTDADFRKQALQHAVRPYDEQE
jgi:hypothetical protein